MMNELSMEQNEQNPATDVKNFNDLNEYMILHVFSYLDKTALNTSMEVCKK